jgi:hypothetical protein
MKTRTLAFVLLALACSTPTLLAGATGTAAILAIIATAARGLARAAP